MAKVKTVGYGTLVKCDTDGNGSGHVTIGCVKNTTPPEKSLKTVDGTCLEDTREQMDPGIEEATEFRFLEIWDMNETNDAALDTLYANAKSRTSPYNVEWQVVYPQATPVTDEFTGWVKKLGVQQIVNGEYIQREVTVQVTSVITRT
jgi:hypothetical protein